MSNKVQAYEDYLASISMTLADLADELATVQFEIDSLTLTNYEPRGTIVKAMKDQTRFKPKSVWVSLGDGTYKHLTGSKGLIAKAERLNGYTEVVFRP